MYWLLAVGSWSLIELIWLNLIGDFGLSFHQVVGLAGVLTALTIVIVSRFDTSNG